MKKKHVLGERWRSCTFLLFSMQSASACQRIHTDGHECSFLQNQLFMNISIWPHCTITVYLYLCSLLRICTELQWHLGVNCMRGQNLGNKKHSLFCVTLIGYQHEDSWKKITFALDVVCGGQCNRFYNKIGFCEPWGIFISHKGDSKETISLKYVDLMVSVMSVWIIRAILALMAMWKLEGEARK